VPGAFPLDLCPSWVLRRLWRGLRWPFVQAGARLFGRDAAEGVAGIVDELAVSPREVESATIRRHPPSVLTFWGMPAGEFMASSEKHPLSSLPRALPPTLLLGLLLRCRRHLLHLWRRFTSRLCPGRWPPLWCPLSTAVRTSRPLPLGSTWTSVLASFPATPQ
jgi:hypothetical protein